MKSATFRRHVDLLSQFGVVAVRDATPENMTSQLSPENVNLQNKTLFHPGCLFLEFATTYNRDHIYLENFQMHTRTMGVIGIVDCEAADNPDERRKYAAECNVVFEDLVKRYPSTLIHKCIAFNPSKDMVDAPLKDISVIPNEGQLSFYIASIINAFTTELLRSFAILIKQIESRPVITGPTPPHQSTANSNGPKGSTSGLAQQISDSITPLGGSTINNSERNKKRTPARALKLVTDLHLLAGRLDIAIQSYQSCLEMMKQNSDFVWWGATLESFQAAILLSLINRSGMGPMAIRQESETSPQPGSIILRPPTTTSLLASPTLMTFHPLRTFLAETPDRHREILQIYEYANATALANGTVPIPILAVSVCIRVARVLRGMHKFGFAEYLVNGASLNFVNGLESGGSDVSGAGANSISGGKSNTGTPTVSNTPNNVGPAQSVPNDRVVFNNGIGANKLDMNAWLMKASNLLESGGVEWIAFSDRVWGYANVAAIFGSIGFRRKHAFFLREMNLVVADTLRPSGFSGLAATARATRLATRLDTSTTPPSRMIDAWKRESLINLEEGEFYSSGGGELRFATEKDSVTGKMDASTEKEVDGLLRERVSPPNGVLQSYKRVCEVFGIQIR
ncbi:Trafficking protein particle complex subunit 9, partial [Podochytrium sp. JEL0797]